MNEMHSILSNYDTWPIFALKINAPFINSLLSNPEKGDRGRQPQTQDSTGSKGQNVTRKG